MQAPVPNRHATALVMGVPTLGAAARDPALAADPRVRLRHALLFSARALLAGAREPDLAAFYSALPDALAGTTSLPAALPVLEVR